MRLPFVCINRFLFITFTAYLVQACGYLQAQSRIPVEGLMVTQYGLEQGLSQSMVSQVMQDQRGLIWMVSGDGLNCFNGEEFRVFKIPKPTVGIAENTMREIIGNTGRFVISTSSSIVSFEPEKGIFSRLYQRNGQYPRIFNVNIGQKILCWMPDAGFGFIEGNKVRWLNLDFHDSLPKRSSTFPYHAVMKRDGNALIEFPDGIMEIEFPERNDASSLRANWKPIAEGCRGLTSDKHGNVFVMAGSRLCQWNDDSSMSQLFDTRLNSSEYLYLDANHRFWISDRIRKRVYCLQGREMKEIIFNTQQGKHIDQIHPSIIHILEDQQGNMWFGTDGDGLLHYTPGLLRFMHAGTGFTRSLAALDGSILAGTYGNGLWRLSEDLSKKQRVASKILSDNQYFLALYGDSRGRMWVVTQEGLFVINREDQLVFQRIETTKHASFIPLPADSLLLSMNNELLVCNTGEKPGILKGSRIGQVRSIIKYGNNTWAGTPFGLYRAPSNQELRLDPGNRISSSAIYALLRHGEELWAATENGIQIYSANGNPLHLAGSLQELSKEIIYSLFEDKDQRIWFSGNRGIGCYDIAADKLIHFNQRNNLQSLEFNHNAFLAGPGGKIYFGGIHGVNAIRPSDFKSERTGPEARLFSLALSDQTVSSGIPSENPEVELDREAAHLSGKVFSNDYLYTGFQQYSFLLEGWDKQWSTPSLSASFNYRNLPPGEYKLFVRCRDAYQNEGKARLLLKVRILPPYWTTWWFILGSMVSILLFTALIVKKIQEARYRSKLQELEQQNVINKERLRISKDMHDEIGASLTRISILSELARNKTSDTGETQRLINQINDISGNVVDEMSEIIWAINPKNDSLGSFAAYLRQYASNYLESTGILIHYHFPDEFPEALMLSEQRRNLFLIAKEALHNVVKHSSAHLVDLGLTYENGLLRLSVIDDGRGFHAPERVGAGNGLVNMQKRMEECGGSLKVYTEPGKGCSIEASIVLHPGNK